MAMRVDNGIIANITTKVGAERALAYLITKGRTKSQVVAIWKGQADDAYSESFSTFFPNQEAVEAAYTDIAKQLKNGSLWINIPASNSKKVLDTVSSWIFDHGDWFNDDSTALIDHFERLVWTPDNWRAGPTYWLNMLDGWLDTINNNGGVFLSAEQRKIVHDFVVTYTGQCWDEGRDPFKDEKEYTDVILKRWGMFIPGQLQAVVEHAIDECVNEYCMAYINWYTCAPGKTITQWAADLKLMVARWGDKDIQPNKILGEICSREWMVIPDFEKGEWQLGGSENKLPMWNAFQPQTLHGINGPQPGLFKEQVTAASWNANRIPPDNALLRQYDFSMWVTPATAARGTGKPITLKLWQYPTFSQQPYVVYYSDQGYNIIIPQYENALAPDKSNRIVYAGHYDETGQFHVTLPGAVNYTSGDQFIDQVPIPSAWRPLPKNTLVIQMDWPDSERFMRYAEADAKTLSAGKRINHTTFNPRKTSNRAGTTDQLRHGVLDGKWIISQDPVNLSPISIGRDPVSGNDFTMYIFFEGKMLANATHVQYGAQGPRNQTIMPMELWPYFHDQNQWAAPAMNQVSPAKLTERRWFGNYPWKYSDILKTAFYRARYPQLQAIEPPPCTTKTDVSKDDTWREMYISEDNLYLWMDTVIKKGQEFATKPIDDDDFKDVNDADTIEITYKAFDDTQGLGGFFSSIWHAIKRFGRWLSAQFKRLVEAIKDTFSNLMDIVFVGIAALLLGLNFIVSFVVAALSVAIVAIQVAFQIIQFVIAGLAWAIYYAWPYILTFLGYIICTLIPMVLGGIKDGIASAIADAAAPDIPDDNLGGVDWVPPTGGVSWLPLILAGGAAAYFMTQS